MCLHHGIPWWHILLLVMFGLGFAAAVWLPG